MLLNYLESKKIFLLNYLKNKTQHVLIIWPMLILLHPNINFFLGQNCESRINLNINLK
jgi:hypothetical protein